MKLKIDIRERELIKIIKALNNDYDRNINIQVENLHIGDIIFYDEKNDINKVIIERKQLSDLASSIKDGRYSEQSMRLSNLPIQNHNIIYLIEGDMNKYNDRYTRVKSTTLYSSMFSLQYFKGFSVMRSFDICETAEILIRYFLKLQKEKKECYYSNTNTENTMQNTMQNTIHDYAKVIKKVKKENIVPENIGSIILSQIPGISTTISSVVMDKFGSLYDLMFALKEDSNCMNNLTYKTSSGQERRISHKAISSIKDYLLYRKSNLICIDT